MGAGAKHSPGQHTFEHRLLADAEQPGNNSPDFFSKFSKHRHPELQPAGTDESEHERSGNFEPDGHRSNGHRNGNFPELQPAWCSDARHWLNRNGCREQQFGKRHLD